jgi:hypothetical protein
MFHDYIYNAYSINVQIWNIYNKAWNANVAYSPILQIIYKSVTEAKIEIRRLTDERNDVHVWEALFDKACEIASEFEIEASRPPVVGRQRIM